jgi:hypothetical protein
MRHGGLKSIYIFDQITFDDADTIATIDNTLYVDQPFPKVYINSHGGRVTAAERIGRVLRRRKASIEGKNFFSPDKPAYCESACVIIAAGAVDRQFDQIGVHRPFTMKPTTDCKMERQDLPEERVSLYMDFFNEMGLPLAFREYAEQTPSREITQFIYDPDRPDAEQKIVQFGFHMHPNPPDHPKMFNENVPVRSEKTIDDLERAANEGDIPAARTLARIFQNGERGQKRDMAKTIKWREKAGQLGDDISLHALGVMFLNGFGVKQDYKRAAGYYAQAAERGFAGSQNNLGWMYYNGDGVKKDYGLAIYWLTRSAEQGEGFAYSSIGHMTLKGHGFPQDDLEAYKWLYLADLNMPSGPARDRNHKMLVTLKRRMPPDQVYLAELKANQWVPLKATDHPMRDKCWDEKK